MNGKQWTDSKRLVYLLNCLIVYLSILVTGYALRVTGLSNSLILNAFCLLSEAKSWTKWNSGLSLRESGLRTPYFIMFQSGLPSYLTMISAYFTFYSDNLDNPDNLIILIIIFWRIPINQFHPGGIHSRRDQSFII